MGEQATASAGLLEHAAASAGLLEHAAAANAGLLARQESRDSLIEVALDNTEQIVSKLLGKSSRSILTARNQSPPLQLSSSSSS